VLQSNFIIESNEERKNCQGGKLFFFNNAAFLGKSELLSLFFQEGEGDSRLEIYAFSLKLKKFKEY